MNTIHRLLQKSFVYTSLGLIAVSVGAAVAQQPPSSSVREAVQVREIEVLFDHPSGLHWVGSKFTPGRMRISEDGQPRQVTRVEPLAEAGSKHGAWRVVICLDRELASADTVNRAVAELASQSSRLVRLGEVEVMVADPIPHQVQAPTRDQRVLQAALQDAVEFGEGKPAAPANEGVFERQLDRVVNSVSPERSKLPGLLIWVTDPWPLPDPVGLWAMQGVKAIESGAPSDSGGAARLASIGRLLAAERWSVAVVAPESQTRGGETGTQGIGKVETSQSPGESGQRTVVLWNVDQLMARLFGWKTSTGSRQAAVAAANQRLDPELAPMQLLAAATQGSLVRSENELLNYLDTLANRWHLFYSAPRRNDATPVPVEVGIVEDGVDYTLARTWRAGTEPAAQSHARLRQALADGSNSLSSNLEHLNCRMDVQAEDGFSLQCKPDASGTEAGRLRVSFATEGCSEAETARIQEVGSERGVGGNEPWQFSVPECARRLAVAIEDPLTGRGLFWAGAVPSTTVTLP